MNNRISVLVTTFLAIFLFNLQAQVTIGDASKPRDYSVLEISTSNRQGGVRLPQLSTSQRDVLTTSGFKTDALACGLAIYNTDTECFEYWNFTRWVSLCEGTSHATLSPEPCDDVAADGTGCDDEFTVTDPDCPAGPFSFAVTSGSDFASLYDVDENGGTFKIHFAPNNSNHIRSAVVRVTSNCTGLYKDFLFTQLAQTCDTSLGTAPPITSVPPGKNINLCEGGAVYLYVTSISTANLVNLIWTRNGVEIARGVNYITVTQAGEYDVWMGIIGCNGLANNAVTVTKNGTGAPAPVEIVVVGNNGLVCSQDGTVQLVAQNPAGGTVIWFKDGVHQPLKTGNQINAEAGQWFAVVNDDGGCYSTPSATVTVKEDTSQGTQLLPPEIDGLNKSFCAGSSMPLSVSNFNGSYTYTWYENNTQIGTGQYILYNVPRNMSSVVIRCRATFAGNCANEALSIKTITTGTIPDRPSITGNTMLCSGSATLNVVPASSGAYDYAWYKDGELIGTDQTIIVYSGGTYSATVTYKNGGCTSPMVSRTIPDASSATPVVTLHRNDSDGKTIVNDVVTYMASLALPSSPVTYKWTVTNATLQSGDGTSTVVIAFNTVGTATVRVDVTNACGTGFATDSPNVQDDCAEPETVTPNTGSTVTVNTVAGVGVTLGPVSATFQYTASPVVKYQWYSNTTNSYSGGTLISGATQNMYIANSNAGTFYYYCAVTNANCASTTMNSGVYQVEVSDNPQTMDPGSGTFTGITCFDINKSNFSNNCGTQAGRAGSATNFATLGPVTYTFKASASGNKSNLSFVVIDTDGAIESWTGAGISGPIANNQTATLVINYRKDLSDINGLIYGRTRENALKIELYAVYNDGSKDVALRLNVSIQDCICCPGYLAVGGEYVLQSKYQYVPLNYTPVNVVFNTLKPYFTATGNDVCFYKKDGILPNNEWITWGVANAYCKDGTFVDPEYKSMGWRLPSIAELAAINGIYDKLDSQPTSVPGTINMEPSFYWSSTFYNSTTPWYYSFMYDLARWVMMSEPYGNMTRCVKTF